MKSFSWWVDRISGIVQRMSHVLRGGYEITDDLSSFVRFASDIFLSRVHFRIPLPWIAGDRFIRVRGGIELHYRLNRGDMYSILEVWINECYRLPFDIKAQHIVDLGANIGLTSLWFAKHYGSPNVIAVEPSADNARVARLNFTRNGIQGEVVEAAVGAEDGTILFNEKRDSNIGRVSDRNGDPVRMVSMDTLLRALPTGASVDLVKMDIEGAEGRLLARNIDWLDRVDTMIMEFHLGECDRPQLMEMILARGFKHVPREAPSAWTSLDAFVRE
jgi:FkbM family methyltransferase